MRRPDAQIRAAVRRLLAPSLTLVALSGFVSGPLHLALVRHDTCLDHGEIVHLDAAQASPARRATPPATHDAVGSAPDPGAHQDHHHCGLASLCRERLAAERAPLLRLRPAPAPVRDGAPAAAPAEPVARLRLAPKSSPPA